MKDPEIEGQKKTTQEHWASIGLLILGVSWTVFQLSTASWLTMDSRGIRSIHLASAIAMVFLARPLFAKTPANKKPKYLTGRVLDVILLLMGTFSAVYPFLFWNSVSQRLGAPILLDIVMGFILLVVLLEACRRTLGPALSIVAVVFIVYAFYGPYFPEVLSFKGVSLARFTGQSYITDEGIFGIPLDVSASIVFLFVLLGALLEKAGAGEYFIHLSLSIVGRFKGGPAKAAVMASGLTGMVSGSSIANIVTTGTFTIPLMKKVGYPAKKAAAIEVAASTDGQIAPPIMGAAAFIIAATINTTYLEVIKAAAIPAFASYATLFYITHLEASKLGLRSLSKKEIPRFFKTFFSGIYFLPPILVLLYYLVIERSSPAKAAYNAVLLQLVIMILKPIVETREENLRKRIFTGLKQSFGIILSAFQRGAENMISVALATAGAGIIVAVVSMGLGGQINEIVLILSQGNIFLLLVIAAIASLIIGMGLPTTATYVVMASLTAPAIVAVAGLHNFLVPLIAAHLFCFYFGILADDTPPVGLAAYAAAAIADSKPIPTGVQGFLYDIRTAILPFMFIFNTEIILNQIDTWTEGIWIFITVVLGSFAFASATQGYAIRKNRLYEGVFFLLVTFIMMQPNAIAPLFRLEPGLESKTVSWTLGILIFLGILLLQRRRPIEVFHPKKA